MNGKEITATIEEQTWLAPAEDVQAAVGKIFEAGGGAGQKIKNFLHGTWLGHPLHPVLTDIPLGAWTVAMVLDGLDAARGRDDNAKAADAAIGIGLVGATGAAVTGITDWQGSGEQAPRAGMLHGMMNLGATALYVGSLVARRRGDRSLGRTLSVLGYAVICASAYIGGELVYGERIGVDHGTREELPEKWTAILPADELPENKLTRAETGDVRVLLVRQGEQILALGEVCSHLGGPLAEGALEGCSVRCPWHGSRFDLHDGRVLDGPATYPQPTFETRVRQGQIEVKAAQNQAAAASEPSA